MVPVGASTLTWPLRKPDFLAQRQHLVPGGQRRVQQVLRDRVLGQPVGGVPMLAHDLQVRLAVLGVAGEGAALVAADARRLQLRLALHDGGDGRRVGATVIGVVGQAAVHEQRAQVGVADAQRPVVVRVLADARRGIARVVDDDLLRGQHDAHRVLEVLDRELAVVLDELHQVQAGEVAGRVVQVHVLGARVAGVDGRGVRAGVPAVDVVVVLDARSPQTQAASAILLRR